MNMKKASTIIILALFFLTWNVNAQNGDKKEKELKSKQQRERSRSLGGQRTQSDIPADQSTTNKKGEAVDTVSTADNAAGSDGVVERNKDQSGRPAKGTAPAVIQRTTSESGSPAVLSEENGGRDGTNNVQRAKPNIAGAKEPGNMNLEKKNSGEQNTKVRNKILKQEERPQADLSRENPASAPVKSIEDKSDVESPNTDENLSRTRDDLSRKEKRKERRRNRRNKDSGQ